MVCAAALGRDVISVAGHGVERAVTVITWGCRQQALHPGGPPKLCSALHPHHRRLEVTAKLHPVAKPKLQESVGELMVLGSSSCHSWEVPGFLLSCSSPFQVVQRIKAVETETRLLVVDKETDEYLCSLRLTCTEEMVHSGILLNSSVSPTKSVGSDNGEVWKPQLDLSGGSLQRHSHSFSSHGSRKVRAEPGSGCKHPGSTSLCKHGLLPIGEKPSVRDCWLWGPRCVPKQWVSCPLASFALARSSIRCWGLHCSLPSCAPRGSPEPWELLRGWDRGGWWGVVSPGDK